MPGALIQAADGNFYGTSAEDLGAVFRMTPSGTITVLHTFGGTTIDGANPRAALMQATDGNFYGTTQDGGLSANSDVLGNGTIFRMTPHGSVTILHAFAAGTDGAGPAASLIQGIDGNFYGTTVWGGVPGCSSIGRGCGTVFRMTPAGDVTVLHAFAGGTDGEWPLAGLLQASDGNFYGTTYLGGNDDPASSCGGTSGCGTVFKMAPSGAMTILHRFAGRTLGVGDGSYPEASLIQASDGNFYGTTTGSLQSSDHGTVFRMTPDGIVTTVFAFDTASGFPVAPLIQATDGNFYGTTYGAPAFGSLPSIDGAVFRMTPGGTVTLLYTFSPGNDPGYFKFVPEPALIQATDGNLIGTTPSGGSSDDGKIFQMTLGGVVTVLHTFGFISQGDGANPSSALIRASDGNFYGTTLGGGSFGGSMYEMTPNGTLKVRHLFGSGRDGFQPISGLIQATDGNLYGTTTNGGCTPTGTFCIPGNGTIFRMTPDGFFTILKSFPFGTEGRNPAAALIQATDGNLYGTLLNGGYYGGYNSGFGSVIQMNLNGTTTVLYTFTGGMDGGNPSAALLQGSDLNFYGTTLRGGAFNQGTVFKITLSGGFSVMHAFTGGADGGGAYSALIQATDGNFYGTTYSGGAAGYGTVFKITPSGLFSVVHAFTGGTDGGRSYSALLQAADGNFYGTTADGGALGYGTVFKITPSGVFSVVYTFSGGTDGGSSYSALIQAPDGSFYGTTYAGGGASNEGIAFRLVLNGVTGDFDGDRNVDPTIYRSNTGEWWVLSSRASYSTNSRPVEWGVSTDLPVPGDYDGDGKTDPAVFRPSTGAWYILESRSNYTTGVVAYWGIGTDIPVPGDYDGDGKTDLAVFRPSNGTWYVLESGSTYTTASSVVWGGPGETLVPGDYDGDGKTDPAVFIPSLGQWWVLYSSTNYITNSGPIQWGSSSAIAVPGDYDGDGKADPAVYFPPSGQWWVLYSSTNYITNSGPIQWGSSSAIAVPGDYDGDGKADPAVYFPSLGQWWVLYSSTGYMTNSGAVVWGVPGDTPIKPNP